nr:hypothetical protein [uncultured Rhodopila sp.]
MKTVNAGYQHVLHAYNHAQGSKLRRQHACMSAVRNAIRSGMHFSPNAFQKIEKDIGRYTLTGNEREPALDRLYGLACGNESASANPGAGRGGCSRLLRSRRRRGPPQGRLH